MSKKIIPIGRISGSAFSEFSDISDFIWKSPRLIASEYKLERAKLDIYFPIKGENKKDDEFNKKNAKIKVGS